MLNDMEVMITMMTLIFFALIPIKGVILQEKMIAVAVVSEHGEIMHVEIMNVMPLIGLVFKVLRVIMAQEPAVVINQILQELLLGNVIHMNHKQI